jgi:hypothetical protein
MNRFFKESFHLLPWLLSIKNPELNSQAEGEWCYLAGAAVITAAVFPWRTGPDCSEYINVLRAYSLPNVALQVLSLKIDLNDLWGMLHAFERS